MNALCNIGAYQRGLAAIPHITPDEARAMTASLSRALLATQRQAALSARAADVRADVALVRSAAAAARPAAFLAHAADIADRGDPRVAPSVGAGVSGLALLDWTGP